MTDDPTTLSVTSRDHFGAHDFTSVSAPERLTGPVPVYEALSADVRFAFAVRIVGPAEPGVVPPRQRRPTTWRTRP